MKLYSVHFAANVSCTYSADHYDNTIFIFPNGEIGYCPEGQVWDQEKCTCYGETTDIYFLTFSFMHIANVTNYYCYFFSTCLGVSNADCDKVLNFTFTGNYDSVTCGSNFAKGVPYHYPSLEHDVLCLNGENQFVSVSV